jgi:hypothetical protein
VRRDQLAGIVVKWLGGELEHGPHDEIPAVVEHWG